jgi:PAS domain S-box-containing protein
MSTLENNSHASVDRSRSIVLRYGCAALSIALATWVRFLLIPVIGERSPYPMLLFAVLLTAWYGGVWPALAGVVFGAIFADYFLVSPYFRFGIEGAVQWTDLILYLGAGVGIAVLGGAMQGARQSARRNLQRAREALAQNEESLRLALRASGIAVWTWDIPRNIVEVDDNCCSLFGVPAGKFPATVEGWLLLVHLDDRERVQQEIAASVSGGSEFKTEFRVGPEGAVRSLAAGGQVYYGEAGQPQTLTGVFRDMTQRNVVEGKFRQLLEAAPDAMVVMNQVGAIVLVNAELERLFGYGREELLNEPMEVLMPAGLLDRLPGTISSFNQPRLRAMGPGLELFGRRKDGTEFPVEISLSPLETEDGMLVSSAIRDISARKREERKFRQFLESAPDAMVFMNREGTIMLVNAELERMFGYQRQELLDQPMEILMPAGLLDRLPGQLSSFNQPRLRTMGPGLELFGRRKDGTEFPVEISLSPLETEDGMLVSSAIRDISERKRSEREIVDLNLGLATRNVELATSVHELAASVQELEAFTSSVAHDLRAPLRHIQAFSTTLTETLSSQTDPAAQTLLHQIVDTTKNMATMVDDLLTLARLGRQELSLQVTGLNSLVQEVIKYLTPEWRERQIDWRFGDLPFVDCDPGLIKQVFFNLLSNALKYTMPRKPAVIEIGCRLAENPPVFFVKDNGVGFNMKYADKLFGVFQRLHRREDFEGVGVGLASVQRIIHKHGGRIWAEAEVDKGATFLFTLSAPPAVEPQAEPVLIQKETR